MGDLISIACLTVLSLARCTNVTREGASYFRRLTSLRDLDFRGCERMSNVRIMYLELLTSLTRINLRGCVVNVSDWSLTVIAGGRGPGCAVLVGIVVRYTLLYIIGGIMGFLSLNVL